MTILEASERYQIPLEILREYERWGLCGAVSSGMGEWQYDDQDLERLSLILTLHDIGFTSEEVETYMRLLLEQRGTGKKRLRMLEQKRKAALDEIHSGKAGGAHGRPAAPAFTGATIDRGGGTMS